PQRNGTPTNFPRPLTSGAARRRRRVQDATPVAAVRLRRGADFAFLETPAFSCVRSCGMSPTLFCDEPALLCLTLLLCAQALDAGLVAEHHLLSGPHPVRPLLQVAVDNGEGPVWLDCSVGDSINGAVTCDEEHPDEAVKEEDVL